MSRRSGVIAGLGVTVAVFVLAWPALAADVRETRRGIADSRGLYDTSRILEYSGNECVRVPSCVNVQSPTTILGPDQIKVLAVQCPDHHPVVWHWDTEQHEHIHVRLVGRTPQGMTFSIRNLANAPGQTRIFVGCSTQPFSSKSSGVQQSRTGIPTRQQPEQGGTQ
jgi:hypothetical protein